MRSIPVILAVEQQRKQVAAGPVLTFLFLFFLFLSAELKVVLSPATMTSLSIRMVILDTRWDTT